MSTVILDADYEGKRKGEKISVPFGKGRDMLTAGIAHYPTASAPQPSTKPAQAIKDEIAAVKAEAIAAMKKQDAEHMAEIAKLEANAKSAFDLADRATAENAELKKQIADLQKSLAEKPKAAK